MSLPPYIKGSRLGGNGTNFLKRVSADKEMSVECGTGTIGDPMVACHPKVAEMMERMPLPWRESHANIARSACIDHGFKCAIIRKEAHKKQYKYDESGRRLTKRNNKGKKCNDLARADLHMTLALGSSPERALVSGHIFLRRVRCQKTGALIVQRMDNPAEQRSIVRPGSERVGEEFWLTRGTKVLQYPNDGQDSQSHI
ncbi:hypothetical protein B0I37DRAFT_359362 [Chaetomium sp. MPI-CAGE-AT-0009]|nr:hypothetical protein B0I37DRAFT_359362 [Chaetomium sp. MPI-CAGE-AT-0009]